MTVTPPQAGSGLRVCIVAPVLTEHAIGGMQQHTDDLARGLTRDGHSVTIVTTRVPEPRERDGVQVAETDVDPPHEVYDRAWGRASAALFSRLHGDRPFDVVHSEGSGGLGLVKHGLADTVPFTVLFHGNWLGFVRAELGAVGGARSRVLGVAKAVRHAADMSRVHFGQGHWRAFGRFEAMVPSRAHLADTIRSHRLRAERTFVVPNGVDVERFAPGPSSFRREVGVRDDVVLLMTVGRLAPDKGVDRALRALAALSEERVHLAVVGDGAHEHELRRLANELGVHDRVTFVGALAQGRVPDALRAADVLWFPTVRDEAAPLVLVQAFASGLPVVASRIGGIPEAFTAGTPEGALVEPGDADAFAAATRGLLRDPGVRARAGEAARRRALDEYSVERMTARTVDVYRRAIGRQAGSRAA